MAFKKVEIAITGNAEGIKNAVDKSISHFSRLDQSIRGASKGLKENFSLESLAKGGLLVSAALNAADIASKALTGDIRQAADAVKELPLGIGQLARTMESLIGQWGGFNKAIEDANRLVTVQNELADASTRGWLARIAAVSGFKDKVRDLNAATARVGLSGPRLAIENEKQGNEAFLTKNREDLQNALRANNASIAEQLRAASRTPITDQDVVRARAANPKGTANMSREDLRQQLAQSQEDTLGGLYEARRKANERTIRESARRAEEAERVRSMAQSRFILTDAFERWSKSLADAITAMTQKLGLGGNNKPNGAAIKPPEPAPSYLGSESINASGPTRAFADPRSQGYMPGSYAERKRAANIESAQNVRGIQDLILRQQGRMIRAAALGRQMLNNDAGGAPRDPAVPELKAQTGLLGKVVDALNRVEAAIRNPDWLVPVGLGDVG